MFGYNLRKAFLYLFVANFYAYVMVTLYEKDPSYTLGFLRGGTILHFVAFAATAAFLFWRKRKRSDDQV